MDEETIEKLIPIIRQAYRDYPRTNGTLNALIAQGLRIGYQRGLRAGGDEPDWVNEFGFGA